MVHMMGNDVDFFWYDTDRQVLRNEPPEPITESISPMRAIAVVPDRAVRTHDDHTVNKGRQDRPPVQEENQEQDKERHEAEHFQPAEKGQSVLTVLKQVQPGKEFG